MLVLRQPNQIQAHAVHLQSSTHSCAHNQQWQQFKHQSGGKHKGTYSHSTIQRPCWLCGPILETSWTVCILGMKGPNKAAVTGIHVHAHAQTHAARVAPYGDPYAAYTSRGHIVLIPQTVTLCSCLKRSHCAHTCRGHTELISQRVTPCSFPERSHCAHTTRPHRAHTSKGHTVLTLSAVVMTCAPYPTIPHHTAKACTLIWGPCKPLPPLAKT